MSAFPNSPRVLKGGIVQVDLDSNAVNKAILLQYKSDAVRRTQIAQALYAVSAQ
jgi:hypothetical protein